MAQTTLFLELHRMLGSQGARALPDAQLLTRFLRQQDEAAFEVLVWRYGPMVWNVCRRILRHRQEAEDTFQATFMLFVRKARSISKRQALASWLYKVAYRLALQARAGLAKRAKLSLVLAEEPSCSSSEDAASREVLAVLDEEVAGLPEKYRAPVILCYFEGKTCAEAASELNCPKGTVSIRLTRAREMLRARLTRRGVALSAGAFVSLLEDQATASFPGSPVGSTLGKAGSEGAVRLMEGALKAMLLTRLKVVLAMTLVLAVVGIGTGWWAYGQTPAEAIPMVSKSASPKPPPVQRPTGRWEREVGPYRVALRIEKDHLFGTLTSKELTASLEADYSVTRDNVLYGVVTALEAAGRAGKSEHFSAGGFTSMRGFEFRRVDERSVAKGSRTKAVPATQLSKASTLVDQPFSIRFRLDDGSLTLKGLKFMGGDGGEFADVIQGRYTKAPASQTKPEDPPNDATVLRALRSAGITLNGSDLQIVNELVARLDEAEVHFYPLVGPARLHQRHWKCTVYFKDAAGRSQAEVVYIDKDHLELTQGGKLMLNK